MTTDVLPEPVTTPGVYLDMPVEVYHADPVPSRSLSSTGARKLLPPSCPALFAYEREHPPAPSETFDIGHAAHQLALGVGPEIVVVDADDWRTKAARETREQAYAEGKCPIPTREKKAVDEMAVALRQHPLAAELLDPEHGRPEVSVFWHDDRHGIDRRCRFDFLRDADDDGRLILVDYKSANSAEPGKFARSVFDFGYDLQDQFYRDGALAAGLAERVDFVFVVQEVAPPYLVTVCELSVEAQRIGRIKTDRACSVFADCTATDTWPSYTSEVALIQPPAWAAYQYEEIPA